MVIAVKNFTKADFKVSKSSQFCLISVLSSRIVDVYYSMQKKKKKNGRTCIMGARFKTVLISVVYIKERRFNLKIFRNFMPKTVNSIINYNQT